MSNFAPDNLLQIQPSGTSGNPASDNRKPRNNAALIFVLVFACACYKCPKQITVC